MARVFSNLETVENGVDCGLMGWNEREGVDDRFHKIPLNYRTFHFETRHRQYVFTLIPL